MNPPLGGLPSRPRRVALRALATVGVSTGLVGALLELSDSGSWLRMAVNSAAAVAFLAAVAFASAEDVHGWVVRARLLLGAGLCSVLAIAGLWQVSASERRVLLLLAPASLLFVTAGLAVREANRLEDRLSRAQLLHQLQGRETERRAWAQELHDQTLQDLAAIDVVLGQLAGRPAAESLRSELEAVRDSVREEISLLRHLVHELRPLSLDVLGLGPALVELGERARDAGDVEVEVDVERLPELIPDAQVAIYRIVQEAVTNALRHAACTGVSVRAEASTGGVCVTIDDDGIGLARSIGTGADGGRGRVGMLERAQAFGGRVTWSTRPAGGTRVEVSLPGERVTSADVR